MASRYVTKNGRTSRRGLFVNGVWHCDCDTRQPADKFQTKNGGKNHGRWFYTCQKSQPSRCGFFLWEDEAKVREEGAVLSNSRTEPTSPKTPKRIGTATRQAKLGGAAQIVTPFTTRTRTPAELEAIPPPPNNGNDEWSDDSVDDDALASVLDEFETPRKVARTHTITSPSKPPRKQSNRSDASSVTLPAHDTNNDNEDIFTTPATSRKLTFPPATSGLITPSITPSKPNPSPASTSPGTLASHTLALLSPITIPPTLQTQLIDLLNKEELRTTGITKGREITREAVKAKEKRINELEARVRGLEQEKETMRNVIALLKSDIATSPKRGRRGGGGGGGGVGRGGKDRRDGDAQGVAVGVGQDEGGGTGEGWRVSVV